MRPLVTFGLVVTLAWQLGGGIAAQAPRDQHEVRRLHDDPAAYIAALEDPARDAYQKPHEVIQALALRPGEVVADVGAGSGYFALRLAHHVGPEGHVYAVDISPDMIRHLNARVRDAGLLNVSTILAQPNDPLLPQPVDRFLFVDVWHHVDDQADYLALIKEAVEGRWPARDDRLPQERAAGRAPKHHEDRPGRSLATDAGARLPPGTGAHVLALPVLPRLRARGVRLELSDEQTAKWSRLS